MFQIKICGVRLKKDVQAVANSQADAIGLNFFPPSVRYVDPQTASTHEMSKLAEECGLVRVGVFVNETVQRMSEIADRVGLDLFQLHGDEPLDVARDLIANGEKVMRAIKLPTGPIDIDAIDARSAEWRKIGCRLLLDADAGASHGGSGTRLHWPSIGAWAAEYADCQWTLAGGLNADNVDDAIRATGARSVDTASGVESSRGVKSGELIVRFAMTATSVL